MTHSARTLAGRSLKPVGLGCMSLSQAYYPIPSEADGETLLHRAIDLGYDHLDTARLYGRGHNEKLLSRVLKTRRDEVFLASKCGIEFDEGGKRYIDCSPDYIRRAVDESLGRLEVDFIDLYYLHRKDFTVPIEESVGALGDLVREGKIGAIGLSEMSADTLRQAAKEQPIAALQNEFSLWTRNPELGTLEACKELGTAFVAFSPVARGVLAGAVTDPATLDKRDLRKNQPRFSPEHWPTNLKCVQEFLDLASAASVTPAQLALAWVLAQGDHVHVIPGTGNLAHMEENLTTLSLTVPDETLAAASALINHETISGHRYPDAARADIDTEDFPQ